jgi:hypothetical protein
MVFGINIGYMENVNKEISGKTMLWIAILSIVIPIIFSELIKLFFIYE